MELYGFNLAINRLNKIAIDRKQPRPFAINEVSIDAIKIVLHSESARQIITHACMARDFNFSCLCYVNYSNFYSTIMTCTVNLFKK